jgi:pimeloyl-[acyl-carrier protein] methyl ester esterase
MKTYIRRREKNNQLVVFYGDCGTDENAFTPLCDDEFDFILFYNYSADEALVLPEMKIYEKITLIGWSFGVWAAEYLSPKTGIKPDVTIAVNGTPVPADDKYGIPISQIEATLNNITEETLGQFNIRMFGDEKAYRTNIDRIAHRTVKSLNDELRWLYNRIMEQKEPGFKWDYAVNSENNTVFPSENLDYYWSKKKDTRHISLPLPHYLFHNWKSLTDFISFVEGYEDKSPKQRKADISKIKGL